MNDDSKTGVRSIAEMMAADDSSASRKLVQIVAAALIGIGLIFTGYLNFLLYSRAFADGMKVLGIIPALLIEGSLATFLLGSFVWFAHGVQGQLSKIFGWVMFAIVAANCLVEFNTLTGKNAGANNAFIELYAYWGVPVVIPLVIAFWKAVIDADPSIAIMRAKRKLAQTIEMGKHDAIRISLGSEASRQALAAYGDRNANALNAQLTGQYVIDATAKQVARPTAPAGKAPTAAFAAAPADDMPVFSSAPAPKGGKGAGPK